MVSSTVCEDHRAILLRGSLLECACAVIVHWDFAVSGNLCRNFSSMVVEFLESLEVGGHAWGLSNSLDCSRNSTVTLWHQHIGLPRGDVDVFSVHCNE